MAHDMPKFANKDEELQYWKHLAIQFSQELDDARDEKRQVERDLEEFQENSQQLEKELETSLEQAEKTTRDLRTRNNRLQLDNDTIRDKFEHLQRQSNMQILELQTSVSEYNNRQETLVKYIRELEQKNDDLERANRAMMTSLGESETKLNTAIERNAILEVEQDETKSILQRLKDESRDLLQEMKIRGPQVPDNDKSLERVCSPIDSNKLTVEIQTQTGIPGSPLKISHPGGIQNIPLTPSTRISGMNIVSDLIRKIGALESKLASCRNASREIPLPGDSMSREVFRGRRLNRGTSTSSIHGYLRA
uniref:NUDE domain-containing protein n=1 Tax=Timema tahoe TaxID=61484 RepID=A0A7R9IJR0_9NEOP|nr:unnamed protein product [Timema tahoe]